MTSSLSSGFYKAETLLKELKNNPSIPNRGID
jgi:hypothetical protein